PTRGRKLRSTGTKARARVSDEPNSLIELKKQLEARTRELTEALEQQTATSEVLRVISNSPTDVRSVLQAIAESVARLLNVTDAQIMRVEGDALRAVAKHGPLPNWEGVRPINRNWVAGRAVVDRTTVQVADLQAAESDFPQGAADAKAYGHRTTLATPLLREGNPIGVILIRRTVVRPLTQQETALLKIFADQAVIAIDNARLFEAEQQRARELSESLQQQTATAEVLKIISRSSTDLTTALDTLVETVMHLCRADQAVMFRRRDDKYHMVAERGNSAEARLFILSHPLTSDDRGTVTARVALEGRPVHIPDVLQDPEYTYKDGQKIIGYRTRLGIPLLREQNLIGIFSIQRRHVEPFADREIELATTFADQAVIAIENARLFEELRDRQAELRVTFDNMGDGVVMFGADTHLVAWNRNFQTILDLPDTLLAQRPTYVDYVRFLAERGEFGTDDIEGELNRRLQDTDRELRLERTRPDGRVIEVRRSTVPGGGFVLIYGDVTERKLAEQAIRAARDAAES